MLGMSEDEAVDGAPRLNLHALNKDEYHGKHKVNTTKINRKQSPDTGIEPETSADTGIEPETSDMP